MDVIANLKQDVIDRFQVFLARLGKGYIDNYSNILDEIAFIQTYTSYDVTAVPPICEHLTNYVRKK